MGLVDPTRDERLGEVVHLASGGRAIGGERLTLTESIRREPQGLGATFHERLGRVAQVHACRDVRVLIGPAHWLCGFLWRLRETNGEFVWPNLSLVVGTGATSASSAPMVDLALAQWGRAARFVAAYETRGGDVVGMQAKPRDGRFVLLPGALDYLRLAAPGVPAADWLACAAAQPGITYELCAARSSAGEMARSGSWVELTDVGRRLFVPVEQASAPQSRSDIRTTAAQAPLWVGVTAAIAGDRRPFAC
jgi:hypothetical protein